MKKSQNIMKMIVGPIRDFVPNEITHSESLNAFKFRIKRWVPEGCTCRISKIYLGEVGFIITWNEIISYHYYHCIQVLYYFQLI